MPLDRQYQSYPAVPRQTKAAARASAASEAENFIGQTRTNRRGHRQIYAAP